LIDAEHLEAPLRSGGAGPDSLERVASRLRRAFHPLDSGADLAERDWTNNGRQHRRCSEQICLEPVTLCLEVMHKDTRGERDAATVRCAASQSERQAGAIDAVLALGGVHSGGIRLEEELKLRWGCGGPGGETPHSAGESEEFLALVGLEPVQETLLEGDVQQVVVIDCADTSGTKVLDADGQPVAGEEYGAKEIQARAELLDGYWIVTKVAVQEIGSCVVDP